MNEYVLHARFLCEVDFVSKILKQLGDQNDGSLHAVLLNVYCHNLWTQESTRAIKIVEQRHESKNVPQEEEVAKGSMHSIRKVSLCCTLNSKEHLANAHWYPS